MNIDELKSTWKAYDAKLQSGRMLSEKIISSMIHERSASRLALVEQRYLFGLLVMSGWLATGIAILIGNPFDYTLTVEYLPVAVFSGAMFILVISLAVSYNRFRNISIEEESLERTLRSIIAVYHTPVMYLSRAVKLILFSATTLFPLSFLPRKLEYLPLSQALWDVMLPVIISAAVLLIAYRLSVFRERQEQKFRKDMEELQSLKGLSDELRES